MSPILDSIADWFLSIGIHPVLGGAICGALLVLVLRAGKRSDAIELDGNTTRGSGAITRSLSTVMQSDQRIEVNVNGRKVEVPTQVSAEIVAHVRAKRSIDAIRLLREATGLDLAAAKAVVDALGRSRAG